MIAALYEGVVEFVLYMGMTENYPGWFTREVLDDIFMDSERYTFWVPEGERQVYYYEQILVEDYCVFIRKTDGDITCISYDVFQDMYTQLEYNVHSYSGVASFLEDTTSYVECVPGVLSEEYPDWFYEYFTESIHIPCEESIFIFDLDTTDPPITSTTVNLQISEPLNGTMGQVSVDHHCVFLRNHLGEIMHMPYETFTKYYTSGPHWRNRRMVK